MSPSGEFSDLFKFHILLNLALNKSMFYFLVCVSASEFRGRNGVPKSIYSVTAESGAEWGNPDYFTSRMISGASENHEKQLRDKGTIPKKKKKCFFN